MTVFLGIGILVDALTGAATRRVIGMTEDEFVAGVAFLLLLSGTFFLDETLRDTPDRDAALFSLLETFMRCERPVRGSFADATSSRVGGITSVPFFWSNGKFFNFTAVAMCRSISWSVSSSDIIPLMWKNILKYAGGHFAATAAA